MPVPRPHRRGATAAFRIAVIAVAGIAAVSVGIPATRPFGPAARQAAATNPRGTAVIDPAALLNPSAVSGLERTGAKAEVVDVAGAGFTRALRVTLEKVGDDTNATQVVLRTTASVRAGDGLLATFRVRGAKKGGGPATLQFLFERGSPPWTKSATRTVTTAPDPGRWVEVAVPVVAAEDYAAGEATVALRLAFGPQSVEIGGLALTGFGTALTRGELEEMALRQSPLGRVTVRVDPGDRRQTMEGFGGNYAKGRFRMDTPNDAAGEYTLKHLKPAHARVGVPLPLWEPQNDNDDPRAAATAGFKDEGTARNVFLLMQDLSKRGIPMVASVWDAPDWMVTNPEQRNQRLVPREKWPELIESMVQFLAVAKDRYGVTVSYISFNEADGGYHVKFTSAEIADFMKQATPRLRAAGLKCLWLAGDTANGRNCVPYTKPLLEDPELKPLLGPVSFHSWDALSAPEESYRAIYDLAKAHGKPVWCMEAGWDAQLWQRRPPIWDTWENAQNLALAYHRSIALAGSSLIDYWEYQEDYPLVGAGGKEYPALAMVRQMAEAFGPGTVMLGATADNPAVHVLAGRAKDGSVRLWLLNAGGEGSVTVSGLPKEAKTRVAERLGGDAPARAAAVAVTSAGTDGLTVPLPPRSISVIRVR